MFILRKHHWLVILLAFSCASQFVAGQVHFQFADDDLVNETGESIFEFVQDRRQPRGRPSRERTNSRNRRSSTTPGRNVFVLASVPDIIGDFFGGGKPQFGQKNKPFRGPPRGGAAVRLVKLGENNSPIPRNRVYATYHFFNDVLDGSFGDVNRYAAGLESTLGDGNSSVEVRFPIAFTLDSRQVAGLQTAKDVEVGNLTVAYKRIIAQGDRGLLSAGVGVAVPTADDLQLLRPGDLRQMLHVENEAVHLLPFFGWVRTNESFFIQTFLQLDIDPNGNSVFADPMAMNLQKVGVVQDPTLLFVDFSVGMWLFNEPESNGITGIAPIFELHYTTSLQNADFIDQLGFVVGDQSGRFDILDMTTGFEFRTASGFSLRPGVVIPLRDGNDRQFDYEVFFQANRYY